MSQRPGRSRLVVVVVLAVVLVALGGLALAPGGGGMEVPAGAAPGSLTTAPCTYPTESGALAADCGTLVVPEKRGDPASALIALPVTRVRSASPAPAEPVFRLGGGPGLSNTDFPQADRFTARRDVVLVGYRGVDGSRRLDCPEVASAMVTADGLTGPGALAGTRRAFGICAGRLTGEGVDLSAYSVLDRVEDLEAARVALGYGRIDLLSSSAGTRTAMVYAWRHPDALARSAMLSVNPPGHMLFEPAVTDAQFAQYAALCRADAECARRTPDLTASLRDTVARLPERWGPLAVKSTNVRILGQYAMPTAGRGSAPTNAPTVLDALTSRDPGALWAMSVLADLALPTANVWGELASFAAIDAPDARAFYAAGDHAGSILGNAPTDYLWGGPDGWPSSWPQDPQVDQYRRARVSEVETLLVSGDLDFATPAQNATRELLPLLPRGRQVVLPGVGHTPDIWAAPGAGDRLLTSFFDTGQADTSRNVTPPVDLDAVPISMSTAARLLVGIPLGLLVLGLGLLAVLVRRRRRSGRTGVVARAVLWLPLGLAGWAAGALAAWTLAPGVSVLGASAVLPGVALFVGLGAALTAPGAPRPAGTAVVAVVGALLGGLLGLHALDGPAAPLTAVVGAAAAAHLVLAARSTARERRRAPAV